MSRPPPWEQNAGLHRRHGRTFWKVRDASTHRLRNTTKKDHVSTCHGRHGRTFWKVQYASTHVGSLVQVDVALNQSCHTHDGKAAPLRAKPRSPSAPWKKILEGSQWEKVLEGLEVAAHVASLIVEDVALREMGLPKNVKAAPLWEQNAGHPSARWRTFWKVREGISSRHQPGCRRCCTA